MGEKQDLIKRMLELQKKFMSYERSKGVDPAEYYAAPEGHELHNFEQEYQQLANRLVEIAHEEKGSHR